MDSIVALRSCRRGTRGGLPSVCVCAFAIGRPQASHVPEQIQAGAAGSRMYLPKT